MAVLTRRDVSGRKGFYPWARWFAVGARTILQRGRDFPGQTHIFVNHLRGKASKLRVSVNIRVDATGREITLHVRGRLPGQLPSRKAARQGSKKGA